MKRKQLFKKEMKLLGLKMRYLCLKLSLEWFMDDHTKDSKKSPIYQFQLLFIGISILATLAKIISFFTNVKNFRKINFSKKKNNYE
jgi:hypothetical protein